MVKEESDSYEQLEVLEFKTNNIEPHKAPDMKVPLSGEYYVARCPNEYELLQVVKQLSNAEKSSLDFDILELIQAFFNTSDARKIHRESKGSEASIDLLNELLPALGALSEHYMSFASERLKETSHKVAGPKAPQDHQRGGHKR